MAKFILCPYIHPVEKSLKDKVVIRQSVSPFYFFFTHIAIAQVYLGIFSIL